MRNSILSNFILSKIVLIQSLAEVGLLYPYSQASCVWPGDAIELADVALWDLLGQVIGQAVYRLLGGVCDRALRREAGGDGVYFSP